MQTTKLYRPVNKAELDLVQLSGWSKFPPRLPEQPIFYPVTNQAYASQITREWNIPSYGNGFVLEFVLSAAYLLKFKIEKVGLDHHTELWVPSDQLEEFNNEIIGKIKVVEAYHSNSNNEYVKVRDVFKIRDDNIIGFEFINKRTNFVITNNSSIDNIPIKKFLDQPRKLDTQGQIDLGYFAIILKDEFRVNPIKSDKVYLLVSYSNESDC